MCEEFEEDAKCLATAMPLFHQRFVVIAKSLFGLKYQGKKFSCCAWTYMVDVAEQCKQSNNTNNILTKPGFHIAKRCRKVPVPLAFTLGNGI